MDPGHCHRPALLPLASAVLLLAFLAVGTASALVWEISAVDSETSTNGEFFQPSIALDSASNARIAYNHPGTGRLTYAAWNGTGWSRTTVDSSAPVSDWPSLALDAAGNPRIAYFDNTNRDLKYAAWTGSAWAISTVDSAGDVGFGPSLALDTAGNPCISYADGTNHDLKYAAWTGSAWAISTVDSYGNVGYQSDLAWDAGRGPRIAYTSGYDAVKYAAWTGTAWAVTTVGTVSNNIGFTSLALDSLQNPRVAYFDGTNKDLKCAASGGSVWQTETVDSAGDTGRYPSLAISGDNPRIAYVDATNGRLKYAAKSGTSWQTETVDTASPSAWMHISMAVAANGRPQIVYLSGSTLKIARAVPSTPSIDIQTEVSVDGGKTWEDADAAPGPSVVAGRPVQWRYVVTNTGNVPLAPVWVEDDREDVTPTAPKTALAAGESMIATFNGTAVAGQHANTGTAYGASGSLTVQDSDGANYLGLALLAVQSSTLLPTDTNGDSLYDDVNGNGRKDFADVVLYFNQMTWIAANEPITLFDCNANGRIDFADVVWLFNNL